MQRAIDVAETVRDRCVEAALRAYEEAGISGLCAEGRWELAVQAMRCLDVDAVLRAIGEPQNSASDAN
jgi:hypothetical protein